MTESITNQAPSAFDSFNARNLRPEQVAKTFVPSEYYKKISKKRHSVVLGPRGSGKTTLFKMLECRAQDIWIESKKNLTDIDFCAVFIPTDRLWNEQVETLTGLGFTSEHSEIFTSSLFCAQVLHRLAECIKYRCRESSSTNWKIEISNNEEYELVKEISRGWRVKPSTYTFNSLISELASRKCEIPAFIAKERILGEEGRVSRIADQEFFFLDFLRATETFIDIVNSFAKQDNQTWALLFDELEIAPASIVKRLMESMRGGGDKILLKLSLAPYNPNFDIESNIFSATDGNDFDLIPLWSAKKTSEARKFCIDLLDSMLTEKGIVDTTAEQIFGKSELDGYDEILDGIAREQDDEASINYLLENNIRASDLVQLKGIKRAQHLRKAIPILRARYEFLREGTDGQRSRKSIPTMYSGANALFDMVEANPRWFIGVFEPLIAEYIANKKSVPRKRQVIEIEKAAAKFLSLLKTIPCPIKSSSISAVGVDKAIDTIGNYFKSEVLGEKLIIEPAGSFVVDSDLSPELKKSLGAALNAGAIVLASTLTEATFLRSLDNQRFRICYLLAPKYRIPLQLMKDVKLKRILSLSETSQQADLVFG
ncbi:hypothetical protein [Pseudomonas fluorescens]|uniref:ORC-CDC6 family AAA ATPase n=1 Tax=Pseudomonas fluorescens TaxID=294 RepID=UPI0011C02BDA|nr:hypothetical protein [Pseudomonas fluorescens]